MFPLNSALDAWQMGNIWQGDAACAKRDFANCSAGEVASLNSYAADFLTDLRASAKYDRPGEGGFIESCLEHCGTQNAAGFDGYSVRGTAARAALSGWWNGDGADPAAKHQYLPCALSEEAPHQCNPSCDAGSRGADGERAFTFAG
jgi:hypothetical protein